MNTLLLLFSHNLLPIFLAAGCGYLAGKYLQVNPRSLSQIAFFFFTPCLIFNLLTHTRLESADVLRMAGFTIFVVLGVGALTWAVAYSLRLERRMLAAVLLIAMFGNAGNFGLSLNLFAFGEEALAYASLYFVVIAILTYTIGALIASLGTTGLREAFLSLARVPPIYAAILGLLFARFGWQLPLPLDRTVSLLGNAAIPVLMVLMGLQLQHARFNRHNLALSLSSFMRLVASPALALWLSLVFGLEGAARQAGVTEAATPAAVVLTVLASEYEVEPGFVATAVFVSTLLSPLTITPLLAYLGA